ncbi:hypothetical protein FOA52_015235 [Chlamydomonas sp. UWO 241]|nr:hypothetical protein FOA52_015235 [Chlamydomonas sp. UWO 241]
MIAGVRAFTKGLYDKLRGVNEEERVPENSGLKPRQVATGRKALRILGIEEPDGLSKHELNLFLYVVGLNPTDDIIDSKLRSLKLMDLTTDDNERMFTFGNVCHVWHSMLQDLTDEEEILRRAFMFFDKDGNGELCLLELRTTMHELGGLLSEEEIQAFMDVMDVNRDGVIGFEEFISTLRTQMPEMGDPDGSDYPDSDGHAELVGQMGQGQAGAHDGHGDGGLIPAGLPQRRADARGSDGASPSGSGHHAIEMGAMAAAKQQQQQQQQQQRAGRGSDDSNGEGDGDRGAGGGGETGPGSAAVAADAGGASPVRAPPGPLGESVLDPASPSSCALLPASPSSSSRPDADPASASAFASASAAGCWFRRLGSWADGAGAAAGACSSGGACSPRSVAQRGGSCGDEAAPGSSSGSDHSPPYPPLPARCGLGGVALAAAAASQQQAQQQLQRRQHAQSRGDGVACIPAGLPGQPPFG